VNPCATPHQDVSIATDAPELTDPQRAPDGALSFNVKGVAGAKYLIHASEDLVACTVIATNTLPAITDPVAARQPHRFCRAVMQ
jgi:hypothetical protein